MLYKTASVLALVYLYLCCVLTASGEDITFSQYSRNFRKYNCPFDPQTVYYNCTGTGNEMNLYAPPYVTADAPLTVVRNDTNDTQSGPLETVPIPVDEPLLSTFLRVDNSLLNGSVNITCQLMPSSQTADVVHLLSGPPLDVSSVVISNVNITESSAGYFVAVTVEWTPTPGDYDLRQYNVQFFVNGTQLNLFYSLDSSIVFLFILTSTDRPLTETVQARVTTVSGCNEMSNGVFSSNNTIVINGSTKILAGILLTLLVSALAVISTL